MRPIIERFFQKTPLNFPEGYKMRFYVVVFLSLLLVACGNEPPAVKKYAETSVEMELVKVSEHTWYVKGAAGVATDNEGFISNAGVIITDTSIIVFDALGTPSLAQKLLREIRKISDKPITKVFVSHYHADHIYGLQVFQDLGAKIIAPSGADEYLISEISRERLDERQFSLSPWVNEQTRIVKPDLYLEKGYSFKEGGVELTVSLIGGAHSDGDLTLYVDTDQVLFSGDIIFEGRIAYLGDADTQHWLETLERMETSKLKALIPGHGQVAADPNLAISQTRRYLAFLRNIMTTAFENLESFDEVYDATDWSEFTHLPAFNEGNRRNAYQVFLSIESEQIELAQ